MDRFPFAPGYLKRYPTWRDHLVQLLDGLYDVIGRPVTQGGTVFVPVIGSFDFAEPKSFLHKHADMGFLASMMDDELCYNNSLWVRARLIKLFGINHPSGHALKTLLNFQAVAVSLDGSALSLPTPFIVTDTFNGFIDDYGYSPDSSIAFPSSVDVEMQTRIADAFWAMMLHSPHQLGIFSDYWYSDYDASLQQISCDGYRFTQDFVGHLYPIADTSPEDHEWWWPFELARKPQVRLRRRITTR